ncbi:MAG: hypothetical protein GYA21_09670 [Myxococcales bacterium]|nr:hypothetical protein [Myxococcales bacterium]
MKAGVWTAADRQVFERATRVWGGPPAADLCRYLDEQLQVPSDGRVDALSRVEIEWAGERELELARPALVGGTWDRFRVWWRGLSRRRTRHELRSLANVLAAPVPEEVGRTVRAGLFRLARAFADRPLVEISDVMCALPPAWQALARAAWESQRGRCPESESRRLREEFARGAS